MYKTINDNFMLFPTIFLSEVSQSKRAKIVNQYNQVQSSTTSDPGSHWERTKLTIRHHK